MRSNQLCKDRLGMRIGFGVVVLVGISALGTGGAQAADCASLANTSIPFTAITEVQLVTGGSFTPPGRPPITGLPNFCRVAMIIKPSSDSNIRAEVWLPTGAWNGRFL